MSRVALSRVVNGKAGISPDLALRLEKAGVSTARFWVNLQANYDLWQAMQYEQPPGRCRKPLPDTNLTFGMTVYGLRGRFGDLDSVRIEGEVFANFLHGVIGRLVRPDRIGGARLAGG